MSNGVLILCHDLEASLPNTRGKWLNLCSRILNSWSLVWISSFTCLSGPTTGSSYLDFHRTLSKVMETLHATAYLIDGRTSYLPPCSLLFTHQAKLGFWEKSSLSGIMDKVKDKNKTGRSAPPVTSSQCSCRYKKIYHSGEHCSFMGSSCLETQIKLHFPTVSPFA